MEDIAIKYAVGHEDNKSENAMVVTKDLLNGMSFPCPDKKCQFYTPVCTHEKVALKVLKIHWRMIMKPEMVRQTLMNLLNVTEGGYLKF